MAKLILEEGGARRAFRFKSGKLTIGSADSCTLTLASAGVAEHHATLVIQDGKAVLQTAAGAEPPLVNGKPAGERVALPAECTIAIGGAILELTADVGAAEAPKSKKPAVRKQAGAAPKTAARAKPAARPARSSRAADEDEDRPARVTHRRREVSKGMPTWMLVCLLLGGAGLVAFGVKAFFDDANQATVDPSVQLREAVNNLNQDRLIGAAANLDKFDANKDLATPEQIKQAGELRKTLEQKRKLSTRAGTLGRATKVLDAKLRKFEEKRLAGNLGTRPRARVFVMRCNEFIALYPDHPEIDWVKRKRDRWAPVAQLDEPRTLEDLQYEVETCTWTATGRRYDLVFKAIAEYLEYAEGADREAALSLREQHLAERQAHHVDRMKQIRYHWEKGETGSAMAHFVYHLKWWGDEEMENEVAAEITQLGGFADWLANFKKTAPDDFAIIVQNRHVRAVAESEGLL